MKRATANVSRFSKPAPPVARSAPAPTAPKAPGRVPASMRGLARFGVNVRK